MSVESLGREGLEAITVGLRSVYQPIVDLRSGRVVGYEALSTVVA